MAKDKAAKRELGKKLAEHLKDVPATLVAEYRGVTAADLAALRRSLREAKAQFHVMKNRLAKKAIEAQVPDSAALKPLLRGPVGLACIRGDVAAGAKILVEFAKTREAFVLKGGVVGTSVVDQAGVQALADLPSKEVLVARMLGSLVAPHRGLLTVINGVPAKLVRVIAAIKDQKSSEA